MKQFSLSSLPALLLTAFLIVGLGDSCKKSKAADSDDGETQIVTLDVDYVAARDVYGEKYTFKVRFDAIGDITEYGIVYKPWIGEKTNKTPEVGDAESLRLPFTASPVVGAVETEDITLRFADFNDANYRAYAITKSGKIIYGEILYISFA